MMSAPSVPDLSATHASLERGAVRLHVRSEWVDALDTEALLDGAPLQAWGEPREHDLRGRGAIHVVATPRGELVAKRLTRGGLIGGLFRETYADPWRPVREAALAEALLAADCPTPPVVVARATRGAFSTWRLELATQRLEGARDLLAVLRRCQVERAPVRALAERVGRSLRRLHDAGLRHRDLQVKNLLVPAEDGPLVVLDLDRCALGDALGADERGAGLLRFLRSLAKHGLLPRRGARPEPAFADELLDGLAAAYGVDQDPGWGTAELRRRLDREVALRAWFWGAPAGV